MSEEELAGWKEVEVTERAKFAEEHKDDVESEESEDEETDDDDDEEESKAEKKASEKQEKLEDKQLRKAEKLAAKKRNKEAKGMQETMEELAGGEDDDEAAPSPAKKFIDPKKRWKQEAASAEAEAAARREANEAKREELAKVARKEEKKKAKLAEAATTQASVLARKYSKELNKIPPNVIELMYLKRTTLLMWLDAPDFAERVTGCMVRICEPENHRRSYEMGIVTGVFDFRTVSTHAFPTSTWFSNVPLTELL